MACNVESFNLGIKNIIAGESVTQKMCINFKSDVAGSLDGKYFVMHEPVTQAKRVFWFDGPVGVDPAIPNSTSHAIPLSLNDSAVTLAAAFDTVASLLTWLTGVQATGDHCDFSFTVPGPAYQLRDALDPLKKTNFEFFTTRMGQVVKDLGPTDGTTTLTVTEEFKDITSPQTGAFLLSRLSRGATGELSFSLKNSAITDLRFYFQASNTTFVTDDANSRVVSSMGESVINRSSNMNAMKIVVRDPKLALANDASQDIGFHKAVLSAGELTFDPENEIIVPITATPFLDKSKNTIGNFFFIGDGAQVPAV